MSELEGGSVYVFGAVDPPRSWLRGVARGIRGKCPNCGVGSIFSGYTRTRPTCENCALDLSGHRADDAPPYVTILIVGHLIIPLALAAKQLFDPPLGVQFAIWLPVMVVFASLLLPASKGAFIGLQWANRMHGFGDPGADLPPAQKGAIP